jgi:hypothetical protein
VTLLHVQVKDTGEPAELLDRAAASREAFV